MPIDLIGLIVLKKLALNESRMAREDIVFTLNVLEIA